jgi:hypothetical protein
MKATALIFRLVVEGVLPKFHCHSSYTYELSTLKARPVSRPVASVTHIEAFCDTDAA